MTIIILLSILLPIVLIGFPLVIYIISKDTKDIKKYKANNVKAEKFVSEDSLNQQYSASPSGKANENEISNQLALIDLGRKKYQEVHVETVKNENVKLEVKDLQVSFRTQAGILKAVRSISFDLHKGETFAIVGESGSGKSVTSKAIIGILSANSIVEGGEILYDGQDLLKISEEDYHKIRGDKIAMIFQDPMSSLNPIMRVGKQLTEAMILKSKAGRKNSRKAFNAKLKLLGKHIDAAHAGDTTYKTEVTKQMLDTFDKFCINNTVIEGEYNTAMAHAVEAEFIIENFVFLVSRKQKVDADKTVKKVIKNLTLAQHPYILIETPELSQLVADVKQLAAQSEGHMDVIVQKLNAIKEIVHNASLREKPNFFTLAYYKMMNPNQNVESMPIKELNEMTRKYLDDNFMNSFIALAKTGANHAYHRSVEAKRALLEELYELYGYYNLDNITKGEAKRRAKKTAKKVSQAIDRLTIKKNSTEYVFGSATITELNRYFKGIKNNPKELKKYNKNKAKYDNDALFNEETLHNYVIEIIDYLKEQASKVVARLTKKLAKAKAIKLMEEVGIPEPAIRFTQYPFEFSGGMRQRIVIAIALSANPDILICDEPTTALDVTIQSQILELINRIKDERNLSVIFITHNLGVVANMADRIAVMYAGKIVEHGVSEEIFYDPKHPYTWALLSSMPDLHTKDRLDSIPGTPPNMIFPPKGDAFAARNKYALKIDFEMQPPMFKVTDTHYAATWLLHPDAPKVELPKIIRDRVERLQKEMEKDGK